MALFYATWIKYKAWQKDLKSEIDLITCTHRWHFEVGNERMWTLLENWMLKSKLKSELKSKNVGCLETKEAEIHSK